jgi:hypothetical protein
VFLGKSREVGDGVGDGDGEGFRVVQRWVGDIQNNKIMGEMWASLLKYWKGNSEELKDAIQKGKGK